jgi:hypothetical protein
MAKPGLRLSRVSVACMAASGIPLPDHHDGTMCVHRFQPDLILVSHSLRKIAFVEVSRPMDRSSEQLAAAHERKMRTHAPLLEALQAYREEGWQVEIFPWVIGVRGLLDRESIKCCLEFLELPLQSWRKIIEDAAKASVTAFYCLHRVRCTRTITRLIAMTTIRQVDCGCVGRLYRICLYKCMLLRALCAHPRRRKPAFITYDNEASMCASARWAMGEAEPAIVLTSATSFCE